ncbi:DNA recombination and repair protein RecO, partial [Pseudomonas sp. FEN]
VQPATSRPTCLCPPLPRLPRKQRAGGFHHPARPAACRVAQCAGQGRDPGATLCAPRGGVSRSWRTEERRPDGKRRGLHLAQRRGPVQRSLPQRTADPPATGRRSAPGGLRSLRRDPAGPGRRPAARTVAALLRMAAIGRSRLRFFPGPGHSRRAPGGGWLVPPAGRCRPGAGLPVATGPVPGHRAAGHGASRLDGGRRIVGGQAPDAPGPGGAPGRQAAGQSRVVPQAL